jgi:hypothetical protein
VDAAVGPDDARLEAQRARSIDRRQQRGVHPLAVGGVDVREHEIDAPVRHRFGVAETLVVAQRAGGGHGGQVERPFAELGDLERELQACRQFELVLDDAANVGDVARNRQQVRDAACTVMDRRDQHVPPSGTAFGSRAERVEMARLSAHGRCHCVDHARARLGRPHVGPNLAAHDGEVVDLHGALAIAVHRPQAAIGGQDLDAVGTLLESPVHVDRAVGARLLVGGR